MIGILTNKQDNNTDLIEIFDLYKKEYYDKDNFRILDEKYDTKNIKIVDEKYDTTNLQKIFDLYKEKNDIKSNKLFVYIKTRLNIIDKSINFQQLFDLYKQKYDKITLTIPIEKSNRQIYDEFLDELYKDKFTLEIFDLFIEPTKRNEEIKIFIDSLYI